MLWAVFHLQSTVVIEPERRLISSPKSRSILAAAFRGKSICSHDGLIVFRDITQFPVLSCGQFFYRDERSSCGARNIFLIQRFNNFVKEPINRRSLRLGGFLLRERGWLTDKLVDKTIVNPTVASITRHCGKIIENFLKNLSGN